MPSDVLESLLDLTGDERVLVLGDADLAGATVHDGDPTSLAQPRGSFDVAVAVGVFHHVRRPELVFAELTRVTRLGGRIIVADRVAPIDPLEAIELDRSERERDPTHTRFLPDADFRHALEANGLVLVRSQFDGDFGWYLARR